MVPQRWLQCIRFEPYMYTKCTDNHNVSYTVSLLSTLLIFGEIFHKLKVSENPPGLPYGEQYLPTGMYLIQLSWDSDIQT